MKTISVKEAAEALGVSPRAVQYKLQNGDLKGTRTKNQYGVAEWRVWPTKEIAEALSVKRGEIRDPINFAPNEETFEAEEISYNAFDDTAPGEPANWRQIEMERLELLAEKLVKPLTERLEAQAIALREQEKIIDDQSRQLRLLPDLQKQAENERKAAEEERQAAELRELEAEALRKQISAIQEKDQMEIERLNKIEKEIIPELQHQLEQERLQTEEKLAASQRQLEILAREKREVEESKGRIEELKRQSQEELERLKEEKEAQVTAVREQLRTLSATVEQLNRPWWKKFFLPAPSPPAESQET
ncbi:MAG: hypothetical protein K2X77_21060 [Candidatus Obscuribacterales bacterium]|nr:hypothetical protein [Candidatus Obscuribacterales bacterium]